MSNRYFVQLNDHNVVIKRVVADDLLWCMKTYGGRWEETLKGHSTQRFARVGMVYVHDDPRRFVRQEEL